MSEERWIKELTEGSIRDIIAWIDTTEMDIIDTKRIIIVLSIDIKVIKTILTLN